MFNTFFRASFLFFSLFSLKLFAAAYNDPAQRPFFYAALAEAVYEDSKSHTQKALNKLLGVGIATVVHRKVFDGGSFGKTNFILVIDKDEYMHVGIEGSSDIGNWVGNAVMPICGAFKEYDVSSSTRTAMQHIITKWEREMGKSVASIVGHSQGGMYASQIVHSHAKHYNKIGTFVVTFNCYKPKKGDRQLHFLIKMEHAASLLTPSGRYIKIGKHGGHLKIKSNHGMEYFFRSLKDKTWDDIR